MKNYQSIRGALVYLKKEDPGTAVSEYLLRQLCRDGKVKTIKSGKSKILVNMKSLIDYLENGDTQSVD